MFPMQLSRAFFKNRARIEPRRKIQYNLCGSETRFFQAHAGKILPDPAGCGEPAPFL